MVDTLSLSPPSEISIHFEILVLYYDIISYILPHLPPPSEIYLHFQILIFLLPHSYSQFTNIKTII